MAATTYRYVGLDGQWPVEHTGLWQSTGGALELAPLPELSQVLAEPGSPVPALGGPAGVGVDEEGTVYVSDPTAHRILRVDPCDGRVTPLPCLRGPGSGLGELNTPRGVAIGPGGLLYVADAGNGRVLLVDLGSEQIRGVWTGASPQATPGAGDEAVGFLEPWDVAVDREGRVYVADAGEETLASGRRGGGLHRVLPGGDLDGGFSRVLAAQPRVPRAPSAVALTVLRGGEAERILVLDQSPPEMLVFRLDGTLDDEATRRWALVASQAGPDSPVAFADGRLYVLDPAGRALAFDAEGRFLGAAPPGSPGMAGLGLDCDGRLVGRVGEDGTILRAVGMSARSPSGAFLAGPFTASTMRTRWQRIRLRIQLPDGSHVRLLTLSSDVLDGSPGRRPTLRSRTPGTPVPAGGTELSDRSWVEVPALQEPARDAVLTTPGETVRQQWAPGPWDATDLFVPSEPAEHLWVAGLLQGDGRSTPVLEGMRLDFDRDGWIRHLPGVFRRHPRSRAFLEPFLLLYETVHEDSERLIADLARLCDPWATPDSEGAAWLDWLAGWMDLPLREEWTETLRRSITARAFHIQAKRGTLASLREKIRLYAGVEARVIDGAETAGVWVLGHDPLGFGTRLADADAQGAVLGITATVDRSHLIRGEEFGAPLLDGQVHCFTVEVYRADLRGEDALRRVRDVIEGEKPAHTVYGLCVVEPRMRVGYQATLGVDTIVAGAPTAAAWDGSRRLGRDTVIPRERGRSAGVTRVGDPAAVGFTLA